MMIKDLIMRLEHLEPSNLALRTEVRELIHRVAKIEENLSLKRKLNNKEQDALHHPPGDTLCTEIIDLKYKHEEIRSQ
jgi:hypothetical protein